MFYQATNMSGLHTASLAKTPLSWRLYRDETDRDQVREMCKNVYGGTDPLPQVVSLCARHKHCMPLVGILGNEVVAFCNLRRLVSDDDTKDVVIVERIRILEPLRGHGLGTALTQEAMRTCETWCGAGKSVRFLSTTVPHNEAMSSIFRKTGWACIGLVELWPSCQELEAVLEQSPNLRGRYLDTLKVSQYVPDHALASLSSWQKLETANEVESTMRRIHTHGGCLLKPGFYCIQTPKDAAVMAAKENGCAWKLERGSSPPILLFYQKANANWFEPLSADLFSACVVDISGAESCVAFAASLKNNDAFTISFDPSITKEKMNTSPLLSQCGTNPFVIYEAYG